VSPTELPAWGLSQVLGKPISMYAVKENKDFQAILNKGSWTIGERTVNFVLPMMR
jgi:hypothetical protein